VVVGKIELPKKTMPPPLAIADTTPADAVASAPPPPSPTFASSPSQLPTKDPKGRFVVQAGAFFEADRVKEVRHTLGQAQIDSYTQIIQTAEGKRTRIRVGPFASREDAEQMLMHIKPLGLDAVVLRI
jgi:DedD protein